MQEAKSAFADWILTREGRHPLTGTILNVITVLIGGVLGSFLGNRLPEKMRLTVMSGLGLMTAVVGMQMALGTRNVLLVMGVICSLIYFFFTVEHKGVTGYAARAGRWVMMLALGAAFGSTVMARVSLFLGRVQFLLTEWLLVVK